MFFFFFFKQKTAYEIPKRDWSSDVCSSDLQCIDPHSNRCIVHVTSWTQPLSLWDYDADKNAFAKSIFNTEVHYPGFENLVADEVEVPGHDGTMIPLSIIHRKDLKLDGSSPAILQGYGAYGISYTPSFNIRHSIALHGVVFAYAHVRGGGEKGETRSEEHTSE